MFGRGTVPIGTTDAPGPVVRCPPISRVTPGATSGVDSDARLDA